MLRTNQTQLHGPFPLPCNSFGQSAAEPPAGGNAGIPVLHRYTQLLLSRLYTRKKRVLLWRRARLGRAAGQHRFAVASASAVCADGSVTRQKVHNLESYFSLTHPTNVMPGVSELVSDGAGRCDSASGWIKYRTTVECLRFCLRVFHQ
jgi:hypothetical protein